MARLISQLAGGAAMLSALSMAATPAAAAALPTLSAPMAAVQASHLQAGMGVQDYEWRGRGRDRHHRDRGGVDGGDILAGVLILGGIAAIASAASKSDNSRTDYPYEEPYDNRPIYNEPQGYMGNGIDNAVDMCVNEIERGNDRVAAVDNAARTSDGWQVSGQMSAGGNFSCAIDNNGRIRNLDVGGGYYGASSGQYDNYSAGSQGYDSQWDDSTYARARASAGYVDPAGVTYDDYYYGNTGG